MSDRIHLKGIRGFGHHGVLDFERVEGQLFIVDICLELSIVQAARFDDLQKTVDYAEVAKLAHSQLVGEPYMLLETLAERIAADILKLPLVDAVEVVVHKPNAPIPLEFDDVTVTIRRTR